MDRTFEESENVVNIQVSVETILNLMNPPDRPGFWTSIIPLYGAYRSVSYMAEKMIDGVYVSHAGMHSNIDVWNRYISDHISPSERVLLPASALPSTSPQSSIVGGGGSGGGGSIHNYLIAQ